MLTTPEITRTFPELGIYGSRVSRVGTQQLFRNLSWNPAIFSSFNLESGNLPSFNLKPENVSKCRVGKEGSENVNPLVPLLTFMY